MEEIFLHFFPCSILHLFFLPTSRCRSWLPSFAEMGMFSLHLPILPAASAPPQCQQCLPRWSREVNRVKLAPCWGQRWSWHDAGHPPHPPRSERATVPCWLQDLPITGGDSKKTSLRLLWDWSLFDAEIRAWKGQRKTETSPCSPSSRGAAPARSSKAPAPCEPQYSQPSRSCPAAPSEKREEGGG